MAEGVGNAPTSAKPILFSRQVQPACICLPSGKLFLLTLTPALNRNPFSERPNRKEERDGDFQ
jgi:hypothetical protein